MSVTVRTGDLDTPVHAAERCLGLFMETLGDEMLDTMQNVAPYDEGELKAGLDLQKTGRYDRLITSEAPHTMYVLEGTGLHGPRRRLIYPTSAEALRFEIGGRIVFAKYTRGQRPQDFVERTIDIEEPMTDRYLSEAADITRRSY